MKKFLTLSAACIALAACSNESYVDESISPNGKQVPISFLTQKKNITRATNLEATEHYNFGVWAQKIGANMTTQKVMLNYLVGYSDGQAKGYDKTNSTTWASVPGEVTDNTSPWFYEGLGKSQYTYNGEAGFYKSSQTAYMSQNENQYLRYWDLAYTNTNFYCYAPYKASGVEATLKDDGSATLTFGKTAISDGYDNTPNTTYASKDRSVAEFMYAGVQATNANKKDITIPFKHMGSQLFICFYEDVPGYKVEIIGLSDDSGNMKTGNTDDQKKGIQATPAKETTAATNTTPADYTKDVYYTSSGATISFGTNAAATPPVLDFEGASTTGENLMFFAPSTTASDYAKSNVPEAYKANLTALTDAQDGNTHYYIPEYDANGTQTYAWSPTIYYPVAQPSNQKVGFTFHVTFRIISDDNKEVTTVHNAMVHVPYTNTTWAANTRYIYRFKITKDATGSTNPGDEIDATSVNPGDKALYPIVFDGCTIEDWTPANSDHDIN